MNIADLVHSADDDETDTVLAGQTSSTIANEDSERDPRVRLLSGSARLRLELAERHLRSRSDETTAGASTTTTDTDLTRDTEHIANTIASLAALSEASTVSVFYVVACVRISRRNVFCVCCCVAFFSNEFTRFNCQHYSILRLNITNVDTICVTSLLTWC